MLNLIINYINLFIPDVYLKNIYSIDLAKLKEQKNIRGIIIDLDNTLFPCGKYFLDNRVLSWIKEVKQAGMKICLVTNTHRKNISEIGNDLGIPFFYSRYKPNRKPFRKAMKIMNTTEKETAVIGDQIFTDVFGGNRLKLLTILVCPISPCDAFGTTYFSRPVERFLISHWLKNGKMKLINSRWPL